ncbi:MAG: DMT family transporter [Dehalococcoidia bacterium]
MPIGAVLLVLGAAVGHASWNFLAKGAQVGRGFTFAIVVASVVLMAPVAAVAAAVTGSTLDAGALGLMAASGAMHTGYFYLLNRGYREGELSLVYPLSRGTGPVFSVAGGILLFDERPSALAAAGIALVITGVLVTSIPRGMTATRVAPSVAFALATGVCIATYTLWDKHAMDTVTPVLYGYGIDVARLFILAPLVLSSAAARSEAATAWREHRLTVAGIAALTPAAYMMILGAFTMAPVSYVAPAREVSILIGAVMGLSLLGEGYPAQKLAGAAAIVAGVVALALG